MKLFPDHVFSQMESCMGLESKVQEMSDELSTNPDFVRKVVGIAHDEDGAGSGASVSAATPSIGQGARPAKSANYSAGAV